MHFLKWWIFAASGLIASALAQTTSPTSETTETKTVYGINGLPIRILPAGVEVEKPDNQDLVPLHTVEADLKTRWIDMTVTITISHYQPSPTAEYKNIHVRALRGLNDTAENAYYLAIHSGTIRNSTLGCQDPAIGSILDPAGIFGKNDYACPRNDPFSMAIYCAVGDLYGKFGAFSGSKNGAAQVDWTDPFLPFNNANNASVIGRTIVLYNSEDARIACGVFKPASEIIPGPVTSSELNAKSDGDMSFRYPTFSSLAACLSTVILVLGLHQYA
jgi:hypothetical protein